MLECDLRGRHPLPIARLLDGCSVMRLILQGRSPTVHRFFLLLLLLLVVACQEYVRVFGHVFFVACCTAGFIACGYYVILSS